MMSHLVPKLKPEPNLKIVHVAGKMEEMNDEAVTKHA